MDEWMLNMHAFAAWLCEREQQAVGVPGRYFDNPVSCWLFDQFGYVYGIDYGADGAVCWRACEHVDRFRLPVWVYQFAVCSEPMAYRTITGREAFMLLACIEQRLYDGVSV